MRIVIAGQKAFGRAVYQMAVDQGHEIAAVAAPPWSSKGQGVRDQLRAIAENDRVQWIQAGCLTRDTIPEGVDLIVAAHSHDWISKPCRYQTRLGGVGYHPSLLPRHRGRSSIEWAIRMGDPVTGGTVYWLDDRIDAGAIAAQDWCWIRPGITPSDLWRETLYPMGVRLLAQVLSDLSVGRTVAIPQDEAVATWEPAIDPPRLRRPDLIEIPAVTGGEQWVVAR